MTKKLIFGCLLLLLTQVSLVSCTIDDDQFETPVEIQVTGDEADDPARPGGKK